MIDEPFRHAGHDDPAPWISSGGGFGPPQEANDLVDLWDPAKATGALRYASEVDAVTWLASTPFDRIRVIEVFTYRGEPGIGTAKNSPRHVVRSHVTAERELEVTSYIAVESLVGLSVEERESFWHDWFREVAETVGRRRKIGPPPPR